MVFAVASRIGTLVARATPKAFVAIEATCNALETEIGDVAAVTVSNADERALRAVIALRAACEVRKQLRGKRKRS